MLTIKINRNSDKPVYSQISDQIISMIENKVLNEEDPLPPTRELSRFLGISRKTVCRSYEDLWSLGYIESRSGSYTRVRNRADIISSSDSRTCRIGWDEKLNDASIRLLKKAPAKISKTDASDFIDLASLAPDPAYWPVDDFRKHLNRIILREDINTLSYEDSRGNIVLRGELVKYLGRHQINIGPENLIITNGSQEAIDLILRLLLPERGNIICEDPTYSYLPALAAYYNGRLLPVKVGEDGPDPASVGAYLRSRSCSLLYTMPSFQNPTGISASQKNRERLLELCEEHSVPLIEDGFVEELKYSGESILPIKSMDRSGIVIYIGTFSKVLFPGLRIGWIAADSCLISRLAELKRISSLSGSSLNQIAMAEYLKSGRFEYYLRKIHSRYGERIETAMKAARNFLALPGVSWTRPAGGYTFIIRWKTADISEEDFLARLRTRGVAVSAGSRFFISPQDSICIRISLSSAGPAGITEGIRIIAETIMEENRE